MKRKLSLVTILLAAALMCTACGSKPEEQTAPAGSASAQTQTEEKENSGSLSASDVEAIGAENEEHSDTEPVSSDDKKDENSESADAESLSDESENAEEDEVYLHSALQNGGISVTYGDFTAQIIDCMETSDVNGNPAMRVRYQFTNNSAQKATFSTSFLTTAYQNDICLANTSPAGRDLEYSAQLHFVEPEESITCATYYLLDDEQSDVLIEVSNLLDSSDDKLSLMYSFDSEDTEQDTADPEA